jgi:hypothetical protein
MHIDLVILELQFFVKWCIVFINLCRSIAPKLAMRHPARSSSAHALNEEERLIPLVSNFEFENNVIKCL